MKNSPTVYVINIIILVLLSSCHTTLFYSKKKDLSSIEELKNMPRNPYQIRQDDKVSVSIWNHDDLSVGSLFGIYNSNEVYGKWVLVDQSGEIQLPQIGTILAEGQTIYQLQEVLKKQYAKYIIDPIIVVKVLNREITVIGEVKNSGTFLLEKEHNTLVEYLGKAGGLNYYADPRHVKLIRKVGIIEKEYLLDLTKLDEYDLHQIRLKADDVIYIPTKKGKTFDTKITTIIPFTSLMTTLAIVYSTFR